MFDAAWIFIVINVWKVVSEDISPVCDFSHLQLRDFKFLNILPTKCIFRNKDNTYSTLAKNFVCLQNYSQHQCCQNYVNIDFSYNRISHIYNDDFQSFGIINVLNLKYNLIVYIEKSTFDSKRLKYLYLNGNRLRSVSLVFLLWNHVQNLINLSGNQLRTIAIDNSLQINEYDLSDNFMNEIVTTSTYIHLINLKNNNLKSCSVIFNISYISKLFIDHNFIEDLSPLKDSYLSQMEILTASHNKISIIQADLFSNASNLQQLDLSHNFISELPHLFLNSMNELTLVDLSSNFLFKINDVSFYRMISLQDFRMLDNPLLEIPQNFMETNTELTTIQLTLHNNDSSWLSSTGYHLKHVKLSHSSIDFLHIPSISYLMSLHISSTILNNIEKGFARNVQFEIESLTILRCNITDIQFLELPDMSKVQNLTLSYNLIQLVESIWFINMINLKILNLSNNLIAEFKPNDQTVFRALEVLDVRNNFISEIFTLLVSLPQKLKFLELRENPVSEAIHSFNFSEYQKKELQENPGSETIHSFDFSEYKFMFYIFDVTTNPLLEIIKKFLASNVLPDAICTNHGCINGMTLTFLLETGQFSNIHSYDCPKQYQYTSDFTNIVISHNFSPAMFKLYVIPGCIKKAVINNNAEILDMGIQLFSNIEQLEINNSVIDDPALLACFNKLNDLSIINNQLNESWLNDIHNMGRLTRLDLSRNNFKTLNVIHDILKNNNPQYLNLSYNEIQGRMNSFHTQINSADFYSVFQNSSLKALDISHNFISLFDFHPFMLLDNFQILNLSNNKLNDIICCLELPFIYHQWELLHLQKLNLAGNKDLIIEIHVFHYMPSLVELDLSKIGQLRFTIYPTNVDLCKLKLNHIRIQSFTQTTCLVQYEYELELSNNMIQNLNEIHLNGTTMRLDLSYNMISKIFREDVLYIKRVMHLNLSYNVIMIIEKNCFSLQNTLQVIDLSGNFLKSFDSRIVFPSRVSSLRKIILRNNDLTEILIDTNLFENVELIDLMENKNITSLHLLWTMNYSKIFNLKLNQLCDISASHCLHSGKVYLTDAHELQYQKFSNQYDRSRLSYESFQIHVDEFMCNQDDLTILLICN